MDSVGEGEGGKIWENGIETWSLERGPGIALQAMQEKKALSSRHSMVNRWGIGGNSGRLYFWGLLKLSVLQTSPFPHLTSPTPSPSLPNSSVLSLGS